MDVEEGENLNSSSFSSSSTEELNDTDPIRISPILVISDDEASMSEFSVRSMSLDSSLMFNYNSTLENLPQTSPSRFNEPQVRSMASSSFFVNNNDEHSEETVAWEDNNEDIIPDPEERQINPGSPSERNTDDPESDGIVYDGENGEDYLSNRMDIRLRQSNSSQIFDSQHGESLDSEDHLFAPEEPPGLDENISPSPSGVNEEASTIPQRLSTPCNPYQYFTYLNSSGLSPLTARYSALRAGNRILPRSTIRNRFSVSSPFRFDSETNSPGSNDCPLNLTASRRLPSYWLNRSRLLTLRNRTRSTYEHLFLRNRLHSSTNPENRDSNIENANTTERNEHLASRRRRSRFFRGDDNEIETLNVNSPQSNSYRSPFNLQSRPNSIEQRTSTFLRSMLDSHLFASLRSPVPVSCVRARSVSPTTAHPWFPNSVDDDSLDDTAIDVRNHNNDRTSRVSNSRALIDGFMNNDNQNTQIERPNTPLPPPISDDESPSTPTTVNFDNQVLGSSSVGITSTTNTNQPDNAAASTTSTRTVGLKEIPQTYEELNYELIQLLECPICFEYSTPPINQCLQGHIICSNCRQRVNSCPTCRNMFQESRNLIMEKVAALLRYPCKNAITGCLETLFLLQKEQHEQSCGFRHYVCFIPMCNWRGYKPELLVHVQETHENHVIHGSSVNLLIPITGQTKKVWLMSAFNELFYVIFFATLGILKGCVRFIGDSSKSDNYTYTISVTSEEAMLRNLNYTRTTHAYEETTENIDILDSYDLFSISYPSLSTFRRGTRAPVRVTVEEAHSRPRNGT